MSREYRHGQPTIGVLAGWQFAWTATPLSYLDPIYRGACSAAHDLGCNLLLGCGMGSWTDRRDSLRPAWPLTSSECDFVPIGPWNTDGLIAVNPLHSQGRSRYLQGLRAVGHPLIYIASGERGPAIVADNRSGILQAMQHLVEHGPVCDADHHPAVDLKREAHGKHRVRMYVVCRAVQRIDDPSSRSFRVEPGIDHRRQLLFR